MPRRFLLEYTITVSQCLEEKHLEEKRLLAWDSAHGRELKKE